MAAQSLAVLQVQESLPSGELRRCCLVLTESVYLLLELNPQHPSSGTLVVWASLQTLARLERDFDSPNKLILHWYKADKQVSDIQATMTRVEPDQTGAAARLCPRLHECDHGPCEAAKTRS